MLWVVWGGLGCAGHCPHHLHRCPMKNLQVANLQGYVWIGLSIARIVCTAAPHARSADCQPAGLYGLFGAVWCPWLPACPMNNLQVTSLQGYAVGCLDWLEYRPHRLYRSPMNNLQVANLQGCAMGCPHHCTACPMQVANLQGYAMGCLGRFGVCWALPASFAPLPHEESAGCQPAGLCLDWVEYRPHRLYRCPPCKICRLPTCRAIWVVWGGLVSLAARLPEQSAGYQPAGLCCGLFGLA